MKKFAVEINYNHYQSKIGYLIEAKDAYEAESIAQRAFLKSHPTDAVLSSHVIEIDATLINTNPSKRIPEERV